MWQFSYFARWYTSPIILVFFETFNKIQKKTVGVSNHKPFDNKIEWQIAGRKEIRSLKIPKDFDVIPIIVSTYENCLITFDP